EGLQLLEDRAAGNQAEAAEQLAELVLEAAQSRRGSRPHDGGDADTEQVLVAALELRAQGQGVLEREVAGGVAEAGAGDELGRAVAGGLSLEEAPGAGRVGWAECGSSSRRGSRRRRRGGAGRRRR